MVSVVLWRVGRLLFPRRHKWKALELESRDGSLIYTVRDCQVCGRREIKQAMRPEWTTFTSTQFSRMPCFEDWHREQYLNAVPRKPNKVEMSHALRETPAVRTEQRSALALAHGSPLFLSIYACMIQTSAPAF